MTIAADILIVVVTILGMEAFVTVMHKHVMHGPGWGWHESHHVEHDGVLEVNDLYSVVFAVLTMGLLGLGWMQGFSTIYWGALGMTIYGFLYFFVHDGLVHQRWPFRHVPRNGYLKRLVQAHRLHHATQGREGGVSFGFLYAPPIRALKAKLQGQAREGGR